MNIANLQQTGGFPLETDTLDFMQSAYNLFNDLGAVIGDKSIVKGCVLTGTTVSDGTIYVNNELLEFRGGLQQSTIMIREDIVSMEFENDPPKEVYRTRYAEFGTGIGSINWSEFKRAYPLTSALVIDEIKMYAGDLSNLPFGWYLCDGQNNTLDLRGQFIVGFDPDNTDYDVIGKAGGEEKVKLIESELPKHTPTGSISYNGSHNHNTSSTQGMVKRTGIHTTGTGTDSTSNEIDVINAYPLPYEGDHKHNLTINEIGNDEFHENRPQFKALPLIQFKGI